MKTLSSLSENSGASTGLRGSIGSAKARRIREAISDLREKRDSCALHDLTFTPYLHKLTSEQKDQAEADLQYRFKLWWATWIEPKLKAIEAELPNTEISHDRERRTNR